MNASPAKAGAQSRWAMLGDAALSNNPLATGPRPSPGKKFLAVEWLGPERSAPQ